MYIACVSMNLKKLNEKPFDHWLVFFMLNVAILPIESKSIDGDQW